MTYKRNSEYWYRDIQPLVKRARRWVVIYSGLKHLGLRLTLSAQDTRCYAIQEWTRLAG